MYLKEWHEAQYFVCCAESEHVVIYVYYQTFLMSVHIESALALPRLHVFYTRLSFT